MNWCHIDLVLYRGLSELRAESNRAYLGVIWWVMEPLLYVSIFYVIFELGLRRGGEGYVSYLLVGLVAWKWFDGTVRAGSNIISTSVGLMNQVYLPKYLLPLSVLVANTAKFLIIFVILLLFLYLDGPPIRGASLLALPMILLVQLLLILAAGGIAAAVVPLVPDLRYVVNYGMTMLFFLSGIFFSIDEMSPEAQALLELNPVLLVIEAYRDVLLQGAAPDYSSLAAVAAGSVVLLAVAVMLFWRLDRVYPRVVG